MKIQPSEQFSGDFEGSWLIVPFLADEPFPPDVEALDQSLEGLLARLKDDGDLPVKPVETLPLKGVAQIKPHRIMCVGLGEGGTVEFAQAISTAIRSIAAKPDQEIGILLPPPNDDLNSLQIAYEVTLAAWNATTCQAIYKQKPSRFDLASLTMMYGSNHDVLLLEEGIKVGHAVGKSIRIAKELINRGPDDIVPETFADKATELAKEYGLTISVYDEKQLADEKMGSMLAVARGSDRPPRMVVLEYNGANPDVEYVGLVGKGVTFDSGGLSLKPSDSMKTMKADMAGAATAFGTMLAVAELKLAVNVRCYLGLVENMVNGSSYKLGSVLTARNGVTIEVMNTDAEGRLVLADVLSFAVDQKCTRLIDLATLTGACVVALGEDYTGVFSNDSDWQNQLLDSAKASREQAWAMPMHESFSDQLQSDVADCQNIGTRWGGAITAAKFLEKFVDNTPWIHLDIAGPSFSTSTKPYRESGATGVMIKTLTHLLQQLSEENEETA